MFHLALRMQLKENALAEYRRAHDQLWPGVARSMAENQVSMAIYHDQGCLYLFATAPTEADWLKSRQHPDLEPWDREMAKLLKESEPGKIDFEPLDQLFGFGDFAETTTC